MQRTYAVFGLMEYTINVTLGARLLKIPFTGGIASKDGVRPATYTTSNPVVQFAIESSSHFKSGRVKIFKTIGEATPNAISVSEAKAAREKAAAAKAAEEDVEKAAEEDVEKTADVDAEEEKPTDTEIDTEEVKTEEDTTDTASTSNIVKVSCLDDAKEYLISNCGGKTSALRSRKAILEYAATHNVVFEGLE